MTIGFGFLSTSRADSEIGVLVMAHGGSSQWDRAVREAVKQADLPYPYRIFFGMGYDPKEVAQLQKDIHWFQKKGARSIVAVPLLISSYSEVYRQWQYLLGVGLKPGFVNNPFFPVERNIPVRFTDALNGNPLVGDILLDRARAISRHPENETVVLIAHGPNGEDDNIEWMKTIEEISARIQKQGGFKAVEGATLRDDAEGSVRRQAVESLRERVEAANRQGSQALVIPFLLSPGGIEGKIPVELKGLSYQSNLKTLLPDARIAQWIRNQVIP